MQATLNETQLEELVVMLYNKNGGDALRNVMDQILGQDDADKIIKQALTPAQLCDADARYITKAWSEKNKGKLWRVVTTYPRHESAGSELLTKAQANKRVKWLESRATTDCKYRTFKVEVV